MAAVKPIPEGYHTITPYLRCRDAAKAIEFYKKAFGATEMLRMNGPDGKIASWDYNVYYAAGVGWYPSNVPAFPYQFPTYSYNYAWRSYGW